MSVVVSKKGVKVKANGRYHSLGDIINGLSEDGEKRLVEGEICERVPPPILSPEPAMEPPEGAGDVEKATAKTSKTSESKKNKTEAALADDSESGNEAGPDTSHPLV